MNMNPIQLFDTESSTFSYILAAPGDAAAVLTDPVELQLADGELILA